MAEFWFGAALGSLATMFGGFIWALIALRRPAQFNQYEVE